MSNPFDGTMSEVKVRATGHIHHEFAVLMEGPSRDVVSVVTRICHVGIAISNANTFTALNFIWSMGEQYLMWLPYRDMTPNLGRNPSLYSGTVDLDVQGVPPMAIAALPANDDIPAHLRVQFGPVIWQVTDQVAFNTVTKVLQDTRTLLADLIAA